MYLSVSLRQRHPRSTWMTLWAVLVYLFCVCQSQNELLLRTLDYPYPLSLNITNISGYALTDVTSETDGNFYRTLTLHDGKLLVGGKAQLFSVNTEDLSLIENATGNPSTNRDDNYVTVIQPNGVNLLECGTLGRDGSPYCLQRQSQNLAVAGDPSYLTRGGYVTAVSHDQNTSFLLDYDTVGSKWYIYTGSDLDANEPSLTRSLFINDTSKPEIDVELESINKRTYLNEAQFVGDPIDYNGRIYFFFREYATEHINGGKTVFSRVARVCKDEDGGPTATAFQEKFVTYGKARLTCSIKGTYDFYFNDIQDVYQTTNDTEVVYAIFTTERSGVDGSALCAYRLDDLEMMFETSRYRAPKDGSFRNNWAAVPTADEPVSRGLLCSSIDTQGYTTAQLTGIELYTVLLDDVAENNLNYESRRGTIESNPLLFSYKERFSQIVVDTNSTDVFYIGTEGGTVLKAYLNENRSKALVVEEISLNTDGVKPVLSMVTSASEQAVFVGTDSRVYKIPFVHCCDYIRRNLSDGGDPYCKSGDGQQDLASCGDLIDRITIHMAPSDRTRAIKIPEQPVDLYLAAKAPGGSNLRLVGKEVDCGDCAPVPYTEFKSVAADGTEFQLVNINATSNETTNCSCSISVKADSVVRTLNFTLTVDTSDRSNATSDDLDDIAGFDNKILLYLYHRNEWLTKIEKACELQNAGTCIPGGWNCTL